MKKKIYNWIGIFIRDNYYEKGRTIKYADLVSIVNNQFSHLLPNPYTTLSFRSVPKAVHSRGDAWIKDAMETSLVNRNGQPLLN